MRRVRPRTLLVAVVIAGLMLALVAEEIRSARREAVCRAMGRRFEAELARLTSEVARFQRVLENATKGK